MCARAHAHIVRANTCRTQLRENGRSARQAIGSAARLAASDGQQIRVGRCACRALCCEYVIAHACAVSLAVTPSSLAKYVVLCVSVRAQTCAARVHVQQQIDVGARYGSLPRNARSAWQGTRADERSTRCVRVRMHAHCNHVRTHAASTQQRESPPSLYCSLTFVAIPYRAIVAGTCTPS
jgi:hypothetical protein